MESIHGRHSLAWRPLCRSVGSRFLRYLFLGLRPQAKRRSAAPVPASAVVQVSGRMLAASIPANHCQRFSSTSASTSNIPTSRDIELTEEASENDSVYTAKSLQLTDASSNRRCVHSRQSYHLPCLCRQVTRTDHAYTTKPSQTTLIGSNRREPAQEYDKSRLTRLMQAAKKLRRTREHHQDLLTQVAIEVIRTQRDRYRLHEANSRDEHTRKRLHRLANTLERHENMDQAPNKHTFTSKRTLVPKNDLIARPSNRNAANHPPWKTDNLKSETCSTYLAGSGDRGGKSSRPMASSSDSRFALGR